MTGKRISIVNTNVPKIYDVKVLQELLEGVDGITDPKYVMATTPIVKFSVPAKGLLCDLNTNDLGGW